ncbi:MAG: glycosyltransferase, partial [Acidobacteria bacterium]|nr:glycosyltransferase [Acidobacteriota bacterium]
MSNVVEQATVTASSRQHHLLDRAIASGKFLYTAGERFLVKGVTYGTFAPAADGSQFPPADVIDRDFRTMAAASINTVRVYTPPPLQLLDLAAEHGLRVMLGLPWSQHVAFLDDRSLCRQIRREVAEGIRALASHPSALMFAIGNEIPAAVVRWHGRERIERFLRELYDEGKSRSPDSLLTYVNYPPTEYLELPFVDVCAFNVYLHREHDLRGYVRRLQHIAGDRPLLLAESGADSLREGTGGQADLMAMQLGAAFAEGACGAVAFAWTDEWWRGGHAIDDWAFGLVDRTRHPKPALTAVSRVFEEAPFPIEERRRWPRVSVVVCAYNAASTIDDCLSSLARVDYPDFDVIVVNDGSEDDTGDRVRRHPDVRLVDTPNAGLSAARNLGLAHATGDIVAYTDADVRVDPHWLTHLVQPFLTSDLVGVGGPNVVPADDPWVAQCIARSPGGPTHVMLDDRVAEHVPGCNMAFRREALLAVGGFNPIYVRAGDDVDMCWRMQARGWKVGFAPAALVWHHHRASIRAYWRQQVGYGEGETWLMPHHPDKFVGGSMMWRGRIYSPLPFIRSMTGVRIDAGAWGMAPFPSVYHPAAHPLNYMPHSAAWQLVSLALCLAGASLLATPHAEIALAALVAGLSGAIWTIAKCIGCAVRTNIDRLPRIGARSRRASRTLYRVTIAWLHLIQPLARSMGRIRGRLAPAHSSAPDVAAMPARFSTGALRETGSTLLALGGARRERRFWSETWTSADTILRRMVLALRSSRCIRGIDVDDGWRLDRDVSVAVGVWAWLDVRVLVEEHCGGKCLGRVRTQMRLTLLGLAFVGVAAAWLATWSILS